MLVTLEIYSCLKVVVRLSYRYDFAQGCIGKLPGAVLQPWGCFLYTSDFFLAVESTELETKVQNPWGRVSLISYRIVVA